MKGLIADANIFLAIALDEPEKERIIQLSQGYLLYAPEILNYEIGNALDKSMQRVAEQISIQILGQSHDYLQ